MNAGAEAEPLESVVAEAVAEAVDANVPLAPEEGAVNVTVAPSTGFESLSRTVATKGDPNAAPTVAVCPDPLTALIVVTGPAVLVRLKLAGVETPETMAITV